ncbi:hypothetical protein [Rummeliibacillus stabekisii]|uniref:Uncharacterized protein n=1 Tax=Rummeliibacillus stabekisii TaxID=241244 RepID=A0A143H8F6_9BACL|nr:hypothetical protein [Rummeliibacillus stabekisii]AMW97982.1 hypothetical protein ATY39_00275 [Rummeliibacillus stabekisii]
MDIEMYKSSDLNPNEEQINETPNENKVSVTIEETIAQNRKLLEENREILPSYQDSSSFKN